MDEAEALGEHDLLRDALAAMIDRIDVLFTQPEPGGGTARTRRGRSAFYRALVYLKDDALLKFSNVPSSSCP